MEIEVVYFLPSLFLGMLSSNVFITTVEGICLLDIAELANLESETLETEKHWSVDQCV